MLINREVVEIPRNNMNYFTYELVQEVCYRKRKKYSLFPLPTVSRLKYGKWTEYHCIDILKEISVFRICL